MSADKLTESDSLPDRSAEAPDKPFPGAPADREPVSAPGPSPSMDQMRAAYASAGSARDIEASAEADEAAAARGPGTGDGPGTVRETAPGVQDGAAVPGTVVPEGGGPEGSSARSDGPALADEVRQPEETARPERADIPAFPGASPDRDPAPAPDPSPSMEQMREAFARSRNSEELQAAARADEAAAKEAPGEKETAAAKPGSGAAVARDAAAPRDPAAGDSGEQRGEEADGGAAEEAAPEQPVVLRAPQQEMPAAEAPDGEPAPLDGGRPDASSLENQPDARHEDVVVLDPGEDTEAEPVLEGTEPTKDGVAATRSDAAAPEADDKPVVQGAVEPDRPEAGLPPEERETGDTDPTRSEVRLDTQSDDQRPVTQADLDAMEARYKAEIGAIKAQHQEERAESNAKIEDVNTANQKLRQKADDLEGKLDTILQMLQGSSDRGPESDERAEASQAASSPEKQPDSIHSVEQRDYTDAPASPDVSERLQEQAPTEERVNPGFRERHLTIKNATAVGSLVTLGSSVATIFSHVPPEIAAGPAAIGAIAGVLGSSAADKLRRRRKD